MTSEATAQGTELWLETRLKGLEIIWKSRSPGIEAEFQKIWNRNAVERTESGANPAREGKINWESYFCHSLHGMNLQETLP